MITKNVNGNNISAGFISQIQSDSPNVLSRIWYNGAELPCDIVDITVEKGSCGQQTFMVGDVIGNILTAKVKNLSTEIKDELIQYHIGALVNGSYEYISLGTFRVSEVKKTRYQSEITAYSSVVADTGTRLDTTGLNNPTIAQLASKVAGKLNCTVTFDTGIDTSLVVGAQLEGLTYYQTLQVIAICSGGYVVNTYDGNVRVHKFTTTPTLSVDTGMMVNLPEIAEQPYTVESVGVMVSEATTDNEGNPVDEIFYSDNPSYIIVTKQGTDYLLEGIDEDYILADGETRIIFKSQGSTFFWDAQERLYILANLKPETADVYFDCPYMTEDIFNINVRGIRGYTYSPATVGLTLGDPRLEGCDVLKVTDVDGLEYIVPCHKIIHKYTGGFTSEITSCDASDNANNIGTSFPITQRLETQARQIGTAQATAENAYKIAGDTNQYFWFTGSGSDTGAHITETPQEQFLADPENGGGNLLARSNGVAIRDGLTELATFGSYGANINENGVSVASFGSTARVGAEDSSRFLMNTDSLQAYDENNAKYFEVTPSSMSYGTYTVANTDDVSQAEADAEAHADAVAGEAEKVATNYLYFDETTGLNIASANPSTATRKVQITASGVKTQVDADNYTDLTSNGLEVVQDGDSVAQFGTTARVGEELGYKTITSPYGFTLSKSALEFFKLGIIGAIKWTRQGATQLWRPISADVAKTFSWLEGVPNGLDITVTCGANSTTITKGTASDNTYLTYDGDCIITTKLVTSYTITQPTVIYSPSYLRFGDPDTSFDSGDAGMFSTAFGGGVLAKGSYQTAIGQFNVADTSSLFLIGNGARNSARSNALQVDSSGNTHIKGDVYIECNSDSTGGTMLKVLKVTASSVSSLSATISNSAITENMECIHSVLSNPSAQISDWTVTTSAGSVVVSGSISGTTDITLYLAEPST